MGNISHTVFTIEHKFTIKNEKSNQMKNFEIAYYQKSQPQGDFFAYLIIIFDFDCNFVSKFEDPSLILESSLTSYEGLTSVLKYQTSNINNGPIQRIDTVHKRRKAACTIFRSQLHGGRPIAIVAGSDRDPGGITAEVWDYTIQGNIWEKSKLISFFTRKDPHNVIKNSFSNETSIKKTKDWALVQNTVLVIYNQNNLQVPLIIKSVTFFYLIKHL